MPPRARSKVARDPTVTRITRADARADPAVQAAVNATVLASRGLAELPTAEETAAIEECVVKARIECETQSRKKKKKKGSDVPTEETNDPKDDDPKDDGPKDDDPKDDDPKGDDPKGDDPKKNDPKEDDKTKKGPKKRETKKEREVRKAKEAEKAAAAEAAAAAAAIEAVEAAKALEAVKALEASEKAKKEAEEKVKKKADEEAAKKAGTDGPIAESVSSEEEWQSAKSGGNKTKSKSGAGSGGKGGKTGGPTGATGPGDGGGGGVNIPDAPTSIDPGDDGTYDDTPKITGTELQRRLFGVDWEALGEKLSTELFNFVRNGGFIDQWKKMREEKEALDDLTEAIGYESPEGGTEEADSGEDTSDEYNKGLEGGDKPETEETEDEPDEENGNEPEPEPDQEKGEEPKADSDPDSEDEEDYVPEDEASTSETNTDTTESEADAEKEDGEEPINPFMFCCVAPDSPVGCYKQRCIPRPPPALANKIATTSSGGSNAKTSPPDAKKTAGKKLKAKDSPEQTPPPETDDEDDSRPPPISCWWPPSYDPNRWDIGATTAVSVPQDPTTAKTRSGKKRKAEDAPEQTPPKKTKLDEGTGGMTTRCPGPDDDFRRTIISCPGTTTSMPQDPTTAKTRSRKKRKAKDSPEETPPKKAKLDEGTGGMTTRCPGPDDDFRRTIISCPGPRTHDTRSTTRAKKTVLKDPPKAKKRVKRVSFKTPEQSASTKKKSDETPMCKLPPLKPHKRDSILKEPVKAEKSAGTKRKSTTEPDEKGDTKKRKRGETLVCALPESPPMESKREDEPKRSKVRTRRRGGFV